MSAKKLRQLRQLAYEKQNRRCFYCKYPIWSMESVDFSRFYGLPARLAKYLKCTAEHLVARQDGGRDTPENIVAACLWCNMMRHRGRPNTAPDAAAYKSRVSRLINLGRWHPLAASKRMK